MKQGFKVRIYPTPAQEESMLRYCRISHDMWNFLVAKYIDSLPNTNAYGIRDYSPNNLMSDFGQNAPQRVVLGVLKTYANACKRVYSKIGRRPRFHKYDPNKQSFYYASTTSKIKNGTISVRSLDVASGAKNIIVDSIYLQKLGITSVTEPRFTNFKGKWYLSGSYEITDVKARENLGMLGLDWGIKTFMTSSNGEQLNYPTTVLREFQRINKLKSYRDKKVKGSKNWQELSSCISAAYDRLENLKRDFIEQTTTRICREYDVSIEQLTGAKIKRTQRFIRRLNTISPLGRFREKLEWKCKKFGSTLCEVNPAYTSKTCCICGLVHDEMTLSDRTMICECGNVMDRDLNAAINIAARAVCCSR